MLFRSIRPPEIKLYRLSEAADAHRLSESRHFIGLGKYGKTLTVLTCPSVQDETYQEEDDGDDDERLNERWTPRFHR